MLHVWPIYLFFFTYRHSKFHMWSEEEQAVRRLFNTIRSTNPSAEDLIQLWPKLHHRLLSEHQVATTLCSGLAVPKRRFLPLACNTNLIMAAGATSARDAAVSRQRVVAAHLHGLSAQMVQCISTTLRAEGVAIRVRHIDIISDIILDHFSAFPTH